MVRRKKSAWYSHALRAQQDWKRRTSSLPDEAKAPGTTYIERRGQPLEVGPFPICLPKDYAEYNLLASCRAEALAIFRRHGLEWHGATPGGQGVRLPSTHLLDSQVQCVNALLGAAGHGDALVAFVAQHVPGTASLVPVEDGRPVAFEWIGDADYLGESRGRRRYRGRFATSLDALLVAEEATTRRRTLIAIEWKFTESYDSPVPFRGAGGTDRREVYRSHYEGDNSPFIDKPPIEAFFFEPHYQLMRQALLLSQMVEHGEFGADGAVLLHLVPAGNRALRAHVTDGLRPYGADMASAWTTLLSGPVVQYHCVDSAGLLTSTPELIERYA